MSPKIKELRSFSLSAFFGFLCTWLTLQVIERVNIPASREPSSSSTIWNLDELPGDEAESLETSPAHSSTGTPSSLIDRRANLLVDLYANPSDTKMNGYGGFLAYRLQANQSEIDVMIYCHNLEEISGGTRVNLERNRFIVDRKLGYRCIGLRLEELSDGLKLIELPGGTPAIMIKTGADFSRKTGGRLELTYLAQKNLTKTDLRQLDIQVVRKGPGRFKLETADRTPFNRLTVNVRGTQFWSLGLPTGITQIALANAPTLAPTTAKATISTIDSHQLKRVRD